MWCSTLNDIYFFENVYNILTRVELEDVSLFHEIVYIKHVALKFFMHAWKMMHNRSSTKNNYVKRDLLLNEHHKCTDGCGGGEEYASDLFF